MEMKYVLLLDNSQETTPSAASCMRTHYISEVLKIRCNNLLPLSSK